MELFRILGRIIVDNADAIRALRNTTDEGEKTHSKLTTVFSKIGKGTVVMGKIIGKAMLATGGAVSGLVAKSTKAYADYEQLVGGVETLFGDSAKTVMANAEKAFKTAGMSANAYMETVTGFSASLLQSLGGDTEKAAEKANLALIDMSDNANKMGSDMESIKNAYGGFAKGNYTMLDNLKLGYGGTAGEMARLINDAGILSEKLPETGKGVAEAIQEAGGFALITEAIHQVQTEMDITGTTAKEASTTISGSLASMKSAWENVLTVMAGGEGNLKRVIGRFVESTKTAVQNLLPVVSTALDGVVTLVDQVAPIIIEKIPELLESLLPVVVECTTNLITSLVAVFPDIISALMDVLPMLIDGVVEIVNALTMALPQIIQALVDALPTLIPQLIDGIVSMLTTWWQNIPVMIQPIIDALPEIIISIVNALVENLPQLIEGAVTLVTGLVEALPQIGKGLIDAMPEVILALADAVIESGPLLLQGFSDIWDSIIFAVTDVIDNLVNLIKGLWNWCVEFVGPVLENYKNIISNAWNAVKSGISNIINGIKTTISNVWDGIKTKTSGVFEGIKSTASSVWNGIKTAIETPINKARDIVKTAIDKIKGFFNFEFKWPKLKMPHFGISPEGWKIGDLLEGSIPKLSIDWYAKAMDNPLVMNSPTIFGFNPSTNSFLGGGEAGSEVVAGTNTLMVMISNAVAQQTGGLSYYLNQLVTILADYFPQILEAIPNELVADDGTVLAHYVPLIDREFGKLKGREERGR